MSSKKVTEFHEIIDNNQLLEYVRNQEFGSPTSIQAKAIPALMKDGHYQIHGKTGSGKTLAYLIPVIAKIKKLEAENHVEKEGEPKAVILLPTRELAMQVYSIAKDLSHYAKLRIRKVVGGDKGKSLQNVFRSKIDILITTPDRCLRAFNNKELSPANLRYFIFDEADQLLEPSFKTTVGEIAKKLTKSYMKIYLVSASKPLDFDEIVAEFFPEKKFTTIGKGEENVLNHKVDTYNLSVEEDDKFLFVNQFIKKQGKRNGLIFMGNKARSKRLFEQVKQQFGNKKIFLLHKDLEAKERTAVVKDFRKSGGILVATDIFSRGIDIPHLQWVLNFDLPSEADYYLHRSGRVGRAGRPGDVFNFITSRDTKRQKNINAILGNQGRSDLRIVGEMTKLRSQ